MFRTRSEDATETTVSLYLITEDNTIKYVSSFLRYDDRDGRSSFLRTSARPENSPQQENDDFERKSGIGSIAGISSGTAKNLLTPSFGENGEMRRGILQSVEQTQGQKFVVLVSREAARVSETTTGKVNFSLTYLLCSENTYATMNLVLVGLVKKVKQCFRKDDGSVSRELQSMPSWFHQLFQIICVVSLFVFEDC
jgi:hypothetical protein